MGDGFQLSHPVEELRSGTDWPTRDYNTDPGRPEVSPGAQEHTLHLSLRCLTLTRLEEMRQRVVKVLVGAAHDVEGRAGEQEMFGEIPGVTFIVRLPHALTHHADFRR